MYIFLAGGASCRTDLMTPNVETDLKKLVDVEQTYRLSLDAVEKKLRLPAVEQA